MIISIASGKGGTGKTTFAVNFALSINNVQYLDCDVEEPNSHLFFNPQISESRPAVVMCPSIDDDKCVKCGVCKEICEFNAIAVFPKTAKNKGSVLFLPTLCHGCGACERLCPHGAIKEVQKEIGRVNIGRYKNNIDNKNYEFINGLLNIGEVLSPLLIKQVKQFIKKDKTVIIDAPPGTSCSFIETVSGTDHCILVTEPTLFGLNDLNLAVEGLRKLNIPFSVIINRSGSYDKIIEDYCKNNNISIIMKIPFDSQIAKLYSNGIPFIYEKKEYINKFKEILKKIHK